MSADLCGKTLKGWVAEVDNGWDRECISVFAETRGKARMLSLWYGEVPWTFIKVNRAKAFDQYAPGPDVPQKAWLEAGYGLRCENCLDSLVFDWPDENADLGAGFLDRDGRCIAYCCEHCRTCLLAEGYKDRVDSDA